MSQSDSNKISWKQVVIYDSNALRFTNLQLHQASQFLAILGENLVSKKPDDSNANIKIVKGGLLGRKVKGSQPFRGFIDFSNFSLHLVDDQMKSLWSIPFDGHNRIHILEELKNAVTELGQDGDTLKFIDHYNISEPHPIESGALFEVPKNNSLNTWYTIYNNAQVILKEVVKDFSTADEIRIWPHHFDIGSYISLNEECTRSIGLGLTIPDTMIDDFYFYIYGWRKELTLDISGLQPLSNGQWKTGDWNGGVLPVSSLLGMASETQQSTALQFYSESIKSLLKILD